MMDTPTKEDALQAIDKAGVRVHQRWRHYKTGHVYVVVAVGVMEASLDPTVGYVGQDGTVWFRLLSVFCGRAKQGDGLVPRFVLCED